MTLNEIQEEIREKIRAYIISQKKVHITTIPSSKYPKGKFYNGTCIGFTKDNRRIIFLDHVENVIEISIILITSPDDIEDYRGDENGYT